MNKIKVKWSSTHWFEAVIDLNDPQYEGLSREDFLCDAQDLSQEALSVLETLSDTGVAKRVLVDGTEIHTATQTFNPSEAARERKDRQAELRRKYPYIYANGADSGSTGSHVWNEAEQADHDDAPSTAVHREEWEQIVSYGQETVALEAETIGAAFIVRDENGQPYRMWHLIKNYNPGPVRDRLNRYAGRIADGKSPWPETTTEAAE